MNCELSIIIPVYNGEKYLSQCIDSVVSSSCFGELEVIIINDGSEDNSLTICRQYSKKYDNIIVLDVENGGVSLARNRGIEASHGRFIAFCDADDYYLNDILSGALQHLKDNCPDMLFFNYIENRSDCQQIRSYPLGSNSFVNDINDLVRAVLKGSYFNSIWNKIFNREIILKNQLFFAVGQKQGEDRDFVLRYLSKCKNAYYFDECGYFYRYVQTSAVNSIRNDYFSDILKELDFKKSVGEDFNLSSEEVENLSEKSAAMQSVSSVFILARGKYSDFKKNTKMLFENPKLLKAIENQREIFKNSDSYLKMRELILDKNVKGCFLHVKKLEAKEKIFRILKRK